MESQRTSNVGKRRGKDGWMSTYQYISTSLCVCVCHRKKKGERRKKGGQMKDEKEN